MLDSNDRRPAFDRWFATMGTQAQQHFLNAARAQRDLLQEDANGGFGDGAIVSLIDCMENVWDELRNLERTVEEGDTLEMMGGTQVCVTEVNEDVGMDVSKFWFVVTGDDDEYDNVWVGRGHVRRRV